MSFVAQDPPPPQTIVPRPDPRNFRMARRVFRRAAGSTPISARARAGSAFLFELVPAATVTSEIARARPGRRRRGKCVKPTRGLRRARRCTRYSKAATLTRAAAAGANRALFTGRVGRRALAFGSYRATAVARNATGASPPRHATFRLVRR